MTAACTLYGVGVGPGAPDLLTFRAVSVLRSADVLVVPRSTDYGQSMAWKIVRSHLADVLDQTRLFCTFPMSHDPATVAQAWQRAYQRLDEHVAAGRSVAFVAEGDPMLFSTFGYLLREAPHRWPGIDVQIVPGVTSVTAVPSVTGVPLADGHERIAIVPAAYDVDELSDILDRFDTVVMMKIGPSMARVIELLERKGLADKTVYVSKATMAEQRVERDIHAIDDARGDCFAMMIMAKRARSGRLIDPPKALT